MKKGKFLFLFTWVLILGFNQLNAQTALQVNYNDGTVQSYEVSESGKLYFSNANLLINTDGTNTTSIPVSTIRSIVFTESLATVNVVESNQVKTILYPNPASNYFQIDSNQSDELDVKIFNVQGQLVLKGKYNPNSPIDISKLNAGIYFVKANNANLKLIKK